MNMGGAEGYRNKCILLVDNMLARVKFCYLDSKHQIVYNVCGDVAARTVALSYVRS